MSNESSAAITKTTRFHIGHPSTDDGGPLYAPSIILENLLSWEGLMCMPVKV